MVRKSKRSTITKLYKFRIYPSKDQIKKFDQFFGARRFIYNHFLALKKEHHKNGLKFSFYKEDQATLTQLRKSLEWMKTIHSQACQAALRDLHQAYKNFFSPKLKAGPPKFKKRNFSEKSFRIPQGIKIEENLLKMPAFLEGIRIKRHREINGKISFCTIKKTSTNKYFASLCFHDQKQKKLKRTKNEVGLDFGIKNALIEDNGEKHDKHQNLDKYHKKLRKNQRKLSKKKRGSNNYKKQKLKVARCHEKVKNVRKDKLDKISKKIIDENQAIYLEDLTVQFMIKNRNLAFAASNTAISMLKSMIEYKASWYGRELVLVPPRNTSKTCHACDWVNKDLKLKDREWTCLSCKTHHDRDINAALVIKKKGQLLRRAGTAQNHAFLLPKDPPKVVSPTVIN